MYAHSGVSSSIGISQSEIQAIANGQRPSSLKPPEASAYDVATALLDGGVLPDTLNNNALGLFGQRCVHDLSIWSACNCLVSVTLNGFNVPIPPGGSIPAPPKHESVYQTISPFTEKVEKVFPEMTDGEVWAALDKAQHAYENEWGRRPVDERAAIVGKAGTILRKKAEEYSPLMTREMGKQIDQARYEVNLSADILEYYATHAEKFLAPVTVPESSRSVSHRTHQRAPRHRALELPLLPAHPCR